ncbi:MAG TPA: monofunctional biosynthetic peptidoglycan transglycosylase [Candidatus Kapabacteria bacterium]|jgi:monofunctional biosynthetic peptidoglycan transglycosylase|nr:monofunctional biosynthetic peptidoglycan transglycosylase [Candidatus Kapabacteria bacterium]
MNSLESIIQQESTTAIAGEQVAVGGKISAPIPILRKKRRWFSWLWRVAVLALVIPIVQVALLRFINPPVTTMMFFRMFDHLFAGESVLWSHTNLGRGEISPSLYSAIISGEDQRFFLHHGFDMTEIENAEKAHARHPNRPMRGASTISQQVAKNLFLPPWHSYIRKGIEAYYTVLIEFLWPKERILQMYANIAEFAPNVYGAEAGAEFHFKRHAVALSPQQSAQMAAVLPNPVRWNASRPSAYIQRRAARILRQMHGLPADEEDDGEPD